jgi:Ssp1 endopeptidase immunity protein Rap1a
LANPPDKTAGSSSASPGDESYERLSDVFIRFARANPQHNDRAAAAIFVAAFAASYPCN